jgi:hypothetical protein
MIDKCECKHEGQDKLHGKGNRVFNSCSNGSKIRCTVCDKEKMSKYIESKK